jgi:hypothetical protein
MTTTATTLTASLTASIAADRPAVSLDLVKPFDAAKSGLGLIDNLIARYVASGDNARADAARARRADRIVGAEQAHTAEVARIGARAIEAAAALCLSHQSAPRPADALLTDQQAVVALTGFNFILLGEHAPTVYADRIEGYVDCGERGIHRACVAHPDAVFPIAGFHRAASVEFPYYGGEDVDFQILHACTPDARYGGACYACRGEG